MTDDLHLDDGLAARWTPAPDGGFDGRLPDGWAQGRSIFGGLSAAFAVALGRKVADPARRLRHAAFSMMRPLAPGPVHGVVEVLRTGRTTQFVAARLDQEGAPALDARLLYARPVPGASVAVDPPPPPPAPPPETLAGFPEDDPLAPGFLRHVEVRLVERNLPFRGGCDPSFDGYCRFRRPFGGEVGIVALVDVWPCPSLALCDGPAPASTVTWSLHLLAPPPARTEGFFRYRYRTVAGAGGFHTAAGTLYDPDGRALAHSEQLVAVFDGRRPARDGGAPG